MTQTPMTRADHIGSGPFDSIAWAFETHVRAPDQRKFQFAILHGNEDCPEKIEFWCSTMPDYDDAPDFVWNNPAYS